jgi:phage terminase large subunit-like protein
MIISIDAATTNDNFAVVMVSRRDSDVYVHYSRCWKPPKGGTIDFKEPEVEIRRLIREYNCLEVCYDPYQLHSLVSRIRDEEFVNTRAFSQSGDRLLSDKRLYDTIRERRVHHHGEPDLIAHIGNAAAELNKNENTLRLVKRSPDLKIDLAVALSQAVHRSFAYAF